MLKNAQLRNLLYPEIRVSLDARSSSVASIPVNSQYLTVILREQYLLQFAVQIPVDYFLGPHL
ncbi:hypothetical protein NQ315_015299 [Exocentrus adspersus]|uniref:Uncharacterized protein n=1 Tax=Exocentrus adspersus TaxID=1586481 RepID=A0AAV8VAL2_9CUCU|nr:hypothetical protein NQ315_015299 [Exocentrus adspersus]